MQDCIEVPVWPYAYGGPSGRGVIRTFPEDFIVKERLSFEPSGAGEHVFLLIEKKGENTEFVARQLARLAGVRQRDIGYAGLKDRHAAATQWFSVWLPGARAPDWSAFESDTVKVLKIARHARKLKRGALTGNSFELLIRGWQGDNERLDEQLAAIALYGIPNYYGEQRFGRQGRNLHKVLEVFGGARVKREQRSLYLSAARSFLFNQVLARRVREQSWNRVLPGDALMMDRSHSFFKCIEIDEVIESRVNNGDLHATGVLWGKGEAVVSAEARALEDAVIACYPELAQGLMGQALVSDRRALRVRVENLQWQFIADDQVRLCFNLPAGSYATALLREIIEI